MHETLRADIISRLTRDYGFRPSGDYLRRGKCPCCGRSELFISATAPWVVKCSRENRCGWTASTRELYPDVFGRLNERFPPTTQDPNATADAYMATVRGLTITGIRNWYRQGAFSHSHGDRKTATVVFDIAPNVYMERLIETVTITPPKDEPEARKQNFVGKHKGLWWQPPDFEITSKDELWLVEACIDAISLWLVGIKAVATLSSGNFPDKKLAELAARGIRPRLVWALDNDRAGREAIEKHVRRARKGWETDDGKVIDGWRCRAALIPQSGKKVDWNDVYAAGDLKKRERIEEYRYEGDLFLAPSAMEKGMLYWRRNKTVSFAIEFDTRTWWWQMDQQAFAAQLEIVGKEAGEWSGDDEAIRWEAARRTAIVTEIANCAFQFLYYQRSELTDEAWYYARVRFPHGRNPSKNTFTATQIATAAEFKRRLLAIAPGAVFTGATWQMNWIIKHHLDRIRIVDTVDFAGYSKKHRAYVFGDTAVSNGKVYPINDEDFFEIGSTSVKSLNSSLHLHIGRPSDYRPDWIDLVYKSFGPQGIIAASFFLGSLFAEQIREMHKSFPFLEVVGEAGSGKSTLIEFLWKLLGRNDYEGFDPNKSTLAARARIMSQVSNLPVSFIESDRTGAVDTFKQKQFDWDELKTAYNGRSPRATGIANGSNDTKEPPFRGAVLISQNAPVSSSDAIMQRIIHTDFDTSSHSSASKIAADTLAALPVEAASYFLLIALKAEAMVLKTVAERAPIHEAELLKDPDVRLVRIAKNHGQLKALVEALAELTKMPDDWRDQTLATLSYGARRRQATIASDHRVVEEFWELIDFLGLANVNHTADEGIIALNLNHIISLASKHGQKVPELSDLKTHLKSCRTRPFEGVKTTRSILKDFDTVRTWRFKVPDKRRQAGDDE